MIRQKLKRRSLPLFYKLNKSFNIDEILSDFYKCNLSDYQKYNDLNAGSDFYDKALSYREYLRKWFLTDDEINNCHSSEMGLSGESYRQLALTEYDGPKTNFKLKENESVLTPNSKKLLLQRVDKESPFYIPEADERNYTKRTDLAVGAFAKILDSFSAKVTRSRFAVLMPGFKTATHIDSDTDYTIRIHIPILTNESCVFGIVKNGICNKIHMPADGSAWFVNAGFPHFVENNGTTPRVHIIIALDGQEDLPDSDILAREGLWG